MLLFIDVSTGLCVVCAIVVSSPLLRKLKNENN